MSSNASETVRLEAFADGVFAIAITLLVIEIRLPPRAEILQLGGVGAALASLWPSYVGYAVSFVVIGIMWANHHNLMKLVDRIDHGFIVLTLLLLMSISFMPFPTAVMADHLADPDAHERSVAVAFYCGSFTVTAILYFLMWVHAARNRRLIAPEVPDASIRAITRAYAPGWLLYLAATLFAFVHVALSLGIVIGLAVLYMLPRAGAHAAIRHEH